MRVDYINTHVVEVYLEDGDIIVSSSTHLSGLNIGHAALVIDGKNNQLLEAAAYGSYSYVSNVDSFTNRVNFMILRPKCNNELKKQVVEYAKSNLVNIPYSAFSGSNDTELKKTQCAHLIWYAYRTFGFDLLDKKESIILPYHLANSQKVELVQNFGFDQDQLWNNLIF